ALLLLVEAVRARCGVSGVDVEEPAVGAAGPDLLDDLVHVGQGGAAVEVDAEDIQSRPPELEARRLADPARRTDNQGPRRHPSAFSHVRGSFPFASLKGRRTTTF